MSKKEEAAGVKIPKKVRIQLEGAITQKMQGVALEKEGKLISKNASDIILPILVAYNVKSYEKEGQGKVMQKTSSGSNVDKKKLEAELLKAGLTVKKIQGIIERSSNTWSTPYVEFRREK